MTLISHSSVKGTLRDARAKALAQSLGVTPPQLGLRYGLQRGFVMLFGSHQRKHMVENLDVFKIRLKASEMEAVTCWRTIETQACLSRVPSFRAPESPHREARAVTRKARKRPWVPLVGDSIAELLRHHPDPLRALNEAEVPALVIRSQLSERERLATIDRLYSPAVRPLWNFLSNKKLEQVEFASLGASIGIHIRSAGGAADFSLKGERWRRKFSGLGLRDPIRTLYSTLTALGRGRPVATARDIHSNRTFPEASFRLIHGSGFRTHIDSLHAMKLATKARRCPRKTASHKVKGTGWRYPDAFLFPAQFSALVMLQAGGSVSNTTSSELTIHDVHMDDLMSDCSIHIVPSPWNCPVAWCKSCKRSAAINGEAAVYRRILGDWARHDLAVREGDIYIFNANQVHEVHAVTGTTPRVTLNAFVGYSHGELRVWA